MGISRRVSTALLALTLTLRVNTKFMPNYIYHNWEWEHTVSKGVNDLCPFVYLRETPDSNRLAWLYGLCSSSTQGDGQFVSSKLDLNPCFVYYIDHLIPSHGSNRGATANLTGPHNCENCTLVDAVGNAKSDGAAMLKHILTCDCYSPTGQGNFSSNMDLGQAVSVHEDGTLQCLKWDNTTNAGEKFNWQDLSLVTTP